jgi:hypothetical protein
MQSQDKLLRDSAKDIVYEVLGHYKNVLPWFTGIYEDWTLGSIRINLITQELTFRSENFSPKDFNTICHQISTKIRRDLSPEYVADFGNFSGEPGRLSVGNLIDAVVTIVKDKKVQEIKEIERKNAFIESSDKNDFNHTLAQLYQGFNMLSGGYYVATNIDNIEVDDVETESLIDLLCQENLLGFRETESSVDSDFEERIHIIEKKLQNDAIQWTVKSEGLIYRILTDIEVTEIINLSQYLD